MGIAVCVDEPHHHLARRSSSAWAKYAAVLLVGAYGGLGIHSLLNIQQLFPGQFKNCVFVSIGVIDSATMKGVEEVDRVMAKTRESLERYVSLARRLGLPATFRMRLGTEVVETAVEQCREIAKEFRSPIFFASKLVFQEEHWYQSLLHNETGYQIQRSLQLLGLATVVLPVRVFSGPRAA